MEGSQCSTISVVLRLPPRTVARLRSMGTDSPGSVKDPGKNSKQKVAARAACPSGVRTGVHVKKQNCTSKEMAEECHIEFICEILSVYGRIANGTINDAVDEDIPWDDSWRVMSKIQVSDKADYVELFIRTKLKTSDPTSATFSAKAFGRKNAGGVIHGFYYVFGIGAGTPLAGDWRNRDSFLKFLEKRYERYPQRLSRWYNAIDAEMKILCYKFVHDGRMAINGIIHMDSETEALQVPLIMLSFCVFVEQSQADAEVMKGVTWMQGACLENNLDFSCRIKTGSGTGAITLPIAHFFKDFKKELMQHCTDDFPLLPEITEVAMAELTASQSCQPQLGKPAAKISPVKPRSQAAHLQQLKLRKRVQPGQPPR